MQQRDNNSLIDIIDNGKLILTFVEGVEKEQFQQNIGLQFQVIRGLEVIGEAARRLSEDARNQLPSIPWHEWISFRNRLIHMYDAIDLDIVWETVIREIPKLISTITILLDTLDRPSAQSE